MQKLSDDQVGSKLETVPNWSETAGSIQRTFQFKDFLSAMAFVQKVAELAERCQHHPDILIRWNKVTLTLTTHDASGLTERDFDFANEADALQ